MTWIEFWFGKDEDESDVDAKPKIFKEKKSNFPKNRNPPEALKTFFHATKSEIMDPGNRNRNVRPNLSPAETEALSELMRLQKSRVITIQRCDKGGGIIILNTDEYIRAGDSHLTSSMRKADGNKVDFYREVDDEMLETAKKPHSF